MRKRALRGACPLACAALVACTPEAPVTPVAPSPPPVVAAPAPPAPIEQDPTAAPRIRADVNYLASPELAGRMTGDPGARLAADYIASRFRDLRLVPEGDGGQYLQAFEARVGAKTTRATLGVYAGRSYRSIVENGFVHLDAAEGSATGEASGPPVFVGYGICASAAHWDDYAGADVAGKIAIVLEGTPKPPDGASQALRDFGAPRYKLRCAHQHHAAGVVLVSATAELSQHPRTDASGMGLPAVIVGREKADFLFPTLKLTSLTSKAPWEAKAPARPKPLPVREVTLGAAVEDVRATTWNVVGRLPARAGSPHADEAVVVGAHYDHLGHGGAFSMAPDSHDIHPGADDNASGAALLLETARRLATSTVAPDRSILFIAFGAEELGTLGSRYWVQHAPASSTPLDHVVAMINADMVGRLRDDKLLVDGVGTSAAWRPLVDAAAQGLGLSLTFGAEGFGASDHASFTAVRVPVAFFFTGVHPDYHKPSDTPDKINAEGEARIATLAERLTLAVADAPDRMTFVDAPADPHGGMARGFKVSLGTIPDYGFNGNGVRLDGVRPDAPAARAGVARGDIIVKVGGHDVGNIHDYMFALGELEPGAETTIEVERDGKRLSLKITPAPGR